MQMNVGLAESVQAETNFLFKLSKFPNPTPHTNHANNNRSFSFPFRFLTEWLLEWNKQEENGGKRKKLN